MTLTLTLLSPAEAKQATPQYLHLELKNMTPEVQAATRAVFDLAWDRLGLLVECFYDAQDPLSVRLIDWALDLLDYDAETEDLDEDYLKNVAARMQILYYEKLVNPLDKAPLVAPIMVGNSLWEQWMLQDFLRCTKQPSREERVHKFAAYMIQLINTLPFAQINPTITITDPSLSMLKTLIPKNATPYLNREIFIACQDPESVALKTYTYCQLMSDSLVVEKLQGLQLQISTNAKRNRGLWEAAKQNIAARRAAAEKEANEDTERLKQKLNRRDQAHQQHVQTICTVLEDQRKHNQKITTEIREEEKTAALSDREIRLVRRELSQGRSTISKLQRKAKKKGRSWF